MRLVFREFARSDESSPVLLCLNLHRRLQRGAPFRPVRKRILAGRGKTSQIHASLGYALCDRAGATELRAFSRRLLAGLPAFGPRELSRGLNTLGGTLRGTFQEATEPVRDRASASTKDKDHFKTGRGTASGFPMRADRHRRRVEREIEARSEPPPPRVNRAKHRWAVWQAFTLVLAVSGRLLSTAGEQKRDKDFVAQIKTTTFAASNRRKSPGTSASARWVWSKTRRILQSRRQWRWGAWHQILRVCISLLMVILFPEGYASRAHDAVGTHLLAASLTSAALVDTARFPEAAMSRLRLRLLPREERRALLRGPEGRRWSWMLSQVLGRQERFMCGDQQYCEEDPQGGLYVGGTPRTPYIGSLGEWRDDSRALSGGLQRIGIEHPMLTVRHQMEEASRYRYRRWRAEPRGALTFLVVRAAPLRRVVVQESLAIKAERLKANETVRSRAQAAGSAPNLPPQPTERSGRSRPPPHLRLTKNPRHREQMDGPLDCPSGLRCTERRVLAAQRKEEQTQQLTADSETLTRRDAWKQPFGEAYRDHLRLVFARTGRAGPIDIEQRRHVRLLMLYLATKGSRTSWSSLHRKWGHRHVAPLLEVRLRLLGGSGRTVPARKAVHHGLVREKLPLPTELRFSVQTAQEKEWVRRNMRHALALAPYYPEHVKVWILQNTTFSAQPLKRICDRRKETHQIRDLRLKDMQNLSSAELEAFEGGANFEHIVGTTRIPERLPLEDRTRVLGRRLAGWTRRARLTESTAQQFRHYLRQNPPPRPELPTKLCRTVPAV